MKYAYSTDEEEFYGKYDTPEKAAIAGFEANPDDDTITVAVAVIPKTRDFVNAHRLIEDIQVSAILDEIGEAAEDWLTEVTEDQIQELEDLIVGWLDRVDPIKFFGITYDTMRQYSRKAVMT